VLYNEITQIWQSEVYGQIFLNIHDKKWKFVIVSSMLRSTTELQEISKLLKERSSQIPAKETEG